MNTISRPDLPRWAQYIAQDADGQWWAYETEPNLSHISWYENEVGRILKIEHTESDRNWKQNLLKVVK